MLQLGDHGSEPDFDAAALARWMDHVELSGAGAELSWEKVPGGTQNEIFEIRRGDLRCALRRPPRHAPPGRAEGILREWRVLSALRSTEVPHAQGIAQCSDVSVMGTPFYLMEFIDGWSPIVTRGWPHPFDDSVDSRRTSRTRSSAASASWQRLIGGRTVSATLGAPRAFTIDK